MKKVLFHFVLSACGGTLTATTGILQPPVSGSQYLPNKNCTWLITVTSGTAIKISFSRFNLEGGVGCPNDYVLIRNGLAADSPILGRYCGSTKPAPMITRSNKVSVQFISNGAVQSSGFLLNYTQYVRGEIGFFHVLL